MKNYLILLISTAFFLAACSSSKKMNKSLGAFDKQGHRGCRGLMPENTIPAMIHAIGMNVTTLEMDVVITKDKEVILSHEPFFNHEITTKPDGTFIEEKDDRSYNIYQMNYEAVKGFDVGMKPYPRFPQQQKMKAVKPLLSEVFDSVKNYMMTARRPYPLFNIEIKSLPQTDRSFHPEPSEFVELLMKVILEKQVEEFVIIQSFDIRTLRYLHQKYPLIKTALLIESFTKSSFRKQIKDLGFNPTIYSPEFSLVNDNLIRECHDLNIQVIPWTVNDKEKIAELKRLGVDGVITDYPDLFN